MYPFSFCHRVPYYHCHGRFSHQHDGDFGRQSRLWERLHFHLIKSYISELCGFRHNRHELHCDSEFWDNFLNIYLSPASNINTSPPGYGKSHCFVHLKPKFCHPLTGILQFHQLFLFWFNPHQSDLCIRECDFFLHFFIVDDTALHWILTLFTFK